MGGREAEVVASYKSALQDLTFNSKPLINVLTMLAEENTDYCQNIVQVVCDRIKEVGIDKKLPSLYLLDSILKNIGGDYVHTISRHIADIFCHVFESAKDEKSRMSLFKLRKTWVQYIPAKTLHDLDVRSNKVDPNWPIMSPVENPQVNPIQQNKIHVNPKFLQSAEVSSNPAFVNKNGKARERLLEEERHRLDEDRRIQNEKLQKERENNELMLRQKQVERERVLADQKRQLELLRKQQQSMTQQTLYLDTTTTAKKEAMQDPRLKNAPTLGDKASHAKWGEKVNPPANTSKVSPKAVKNKNAVSVLNKIMNNLSGKKPTKPTKVSHTKKISPTQSIPKPEKIEKPAKNWDGTYADVSTTVQTTTTTSLVSTLTKSVTPTTTASVVTSDTLPAPNVNVVDIVSSTPPIPFSAAFTGLSSRDMQIAAQAAAIATAMHQISAVANGPIAPEQSAQLAAQFIKIIQGTSQQLSVATTTVTDQSCTSTSVSQTSSSATTTVNDAPAMSSTQQKADTDKQNIVKDQMSASTPKHINVMVPSKENPTETNAKTTKATSEKNKSGDKEKVRLETKHLRHGTGENVKKAKPTKLSEQKVKAEGKKTDRKEAAQTKVEQKVKIGEKNKERKETVPEKMEPPIKKTKDSGNEPPGRSRKARARSPSRYYCQIEQKIDSEKRVEEKEKEMTKKRIRKNSENEGSELDVKDKEQIKIYKQFLGHIEALEKRYQMPKSTINVSTLESVFKQIDSKFKRRMMTVDQYKELTDKIDVFATKITGKDTKVGRRTKFQETYSPNKHVEKFQPRGLPGSNDIPQNLRGRRPQGPEGPNMPFHPRGMPPYRPRGPHPPFIRDGVPPPHWRGPLPPHLRDGGPPLQPGDPRPPHPGDPRPPHPGDSRLPHPGDSRPPHPGDSRPAHPGDPRPQHMRDTPPPHVRDAPPPHMIDAPPPHMIDGLPPHMREAPLPHMIDAPLPHMRDAPPPHMRDAPPPHMRDAPPPHMRDAPPPHMRDAPPQHMRDAPPQHMRDTPPHMRDAPPRHMRDTPPHMRDTPPHMRDAPPHIREALPSHFRDGPHFRDPSISHFREIPQSHPHEGPLPIHAQKGAFRPPHVRDDMPMPPEGHPMYMSGGHQPIWDNEHRVWRDSPPPHMMEGPPIIREYPPSHPMERPPEHWQQPPPHMEGGHLSMMGGPPPHRVSPNMMEGGILGNNQDSYQQPAFRPTGMPQNQPGPSGMDVNSILGQLMAFGVIKTDPEEEILPVPDINLKIDELKRRHTSIITQLFLGMQCSSCGERFPESQKQQYSDHLDWHFRENKKEKEGIRRVSSRSWYFQLAEWIELSDARIGKDGKVKSKLFESERGNGDIESSLLKKEQATAFESVPVEGDEGDGICSVCMDPLEEYWDGDLEEWRYKNAVRQENKTFHVNCFKDYVPYELDDTTTPVTTPSVEKSMSFGDETESEVVPNDDTTSEIKKQESGDIQASVKVESAQSNDTAEVKEEMCDVSNITGECSDVQNVQNVPVGAEPEKMEVDEKKSERAETVQNVNVKKEMEPDNVDGVTESAKDDMTRESVTQESVERSDMDIDDKTTTGTIDEKIVKSNDNDDDERTEIKTEPMDEEYMDNAADSPEYPLIVSNNTETLSSIVKCEPEEGTELSNDNPSPIVTDS